MNAHLLSFGRTLLFVAALVFPSALQSQFVDRKTDWLHEGKVGLSTHYLARSVESLERIANQFQAEKVAGQAAETGAAWFLFTIHHQPWLMLAPNASFDRILGDTVHTSERDVPMELHRALSARGIRMMLYVNLRMDPRSAASEHIREAMGGWPPNDRLIENISAVYREFSLRYGTRVSGWWVDAAGLPDFRRSPHRDRWLRQIANALRAGNANAIVAFNSGVRMERYFESDYTAGEMNELIYFPTGRWLNGAQWHAFTYLGGWWSSGGTRFNSRDLGDYASKVVSNGGTLTLDVGTLGLDIAKRGAPAQRSPHRGYIDPAQVDQAKSAFAAARARHPVGAGPANQAGSLAEHSRDRDSISALYWFPAPSAMRAPE